MRKSGTIRHPYRAVITGAFSFTGRCVARRLLDQGVGVGTLTSDPRLENPLGDTVRAFPPDFSAPEGLCRSLANASENQLRL